MKTRVIVGAALVVMLVAMLAIGGLAYIVVLTLFAFAAVYEVSNTFRRKGYNPIALPAYVFAMAFPALYWLFGGVAVAALYFLALVATMSYSIASSKRTMPDVLISLTLFVYPLSLLIATLLTYFSFPHATGLTAACFALCAPEFCDTFAYFGGTLFGKHKLCPQISPKKTVEGSVCATISGVLFGGIVSVLQPLWGGVAPLAVLLMLGFGCGIFSQLGDLFASRLKRWAEVKDFSSVFPGHGGVMDRIDSILFCAPLTLAVFLILTRAGVL